MIKAIIFDMDGTLYTNTDIKEQFAKAAYSTLAKSDNIPIDQAQDLIEKRRAELKAKSGFPVPYTLTLESFDIPIKVWHKENIAFFDPRDFLHKDEKLKASLVKLKKNHRLAVMTNNNRIQTERVIEALELDGLFDRVFTFNSFEILKPDLEFFKKAAAELGIEPKACLYVGDRYDVDLQPAQETGMQILEVKGPEDIYDLANKILKKE